MNVRFAKHQDSERIMELLRQVNLVHHLGRPDVFKLGTKYTPDELSQIINDESRPILVAEDGGEVLGYCFCVYQQHKDSNLLTDIKTLYIDDLCVDESARGKGVGRVLYDAAVSLAKETECYNVTLNVWSCNESALRFYEKLGLVPQKIGMEMILK